MQRPSEGHAEKYKTAEEKKEKEEKKTFPGIGSTPITIPGVMTVIAGEEMPKQQHIGFFSYL